MTVGGVESLVQAEADRRIGRALRRFWLPVAYAADVVAVLLLEERLVVARVDGTAWGAIIVAIALSVVAYRLAERAGTAVEQRWL